MSNNDVLRVGIVGCGAHSHEHFKAAERVKGIKISCCCDIIEERAKACAVKYGCEAYYKDIEDMLKIETLDAVILCTWPMQHMEQIEKCLTSGLKNILCEKSLALSAEEALHIDKLAKEYGAFIMEGCKYRHHPAIRKLESILSYKDIGKIDSIRATFSNYEPEDLLDPDSEPDWRFRKECGGGVPFDWMSYLVNACNHFSRALPKRVFASGDVSPRYGVINRIYGMIEYDNGVVGIIESSKDANFSQELQITCSEGILRMPVAWGIYGEVKITQTHRKQEWDYILTDTYEIEEANAFVLQLDNFSKVIKGIEQPVIPLKQSILNVQTIDALVESMLDKKIVEI
ncbi:MAG: Gfo/Idh/MocA family oxidoreductase [Bacillota bacterium]|nr:Gfo/Idh/MocA family oxidoreductase [Bacillota bacterium]